ncbi:Threonine dehydrogenase [Rubellimicrobium mesophilum DSM 19309]|uniref:Threonine dehydrogenase n=1 Tax=Rubellimicrobium mesophilum DSM 19309 TaxID=442562 RepID=A0A017HJT0_9RHOB|nr:alcohol dehydrogenase catalytic domain-containing protein [Rubellimicrobium mesophilum]EYD74772.1 Threonine dehydrogenase [Rubellimicrobium mesophilum DSM 19309]
MRATILHGQGDVRIETVPDAGLREPTDALIRVARACICGSDLWGYSGQDNFGGPRPMGHEAMGVVEAVGTEVRTLKKGDVVIMPFAISDGTCAFCREGLHTACTNGGFFGQPDPGGAQAEALRVPQADGTLYKVDVAEDDALMPSLLTLSDVMGTGHHAAVVARVAPGKVAAVIGDGAVGLCGVIAAKRLGAERIILLGRHADRIALAREFGATDVVSERGEEAVARVMELTRGEGAHSVLECVGTGAATDTAIAIAPRRRRRSGGRAALRRHPARAALVLQERHRGRGPRPGARLHRGLAAGRAGGPHRARPGVRPRHRPRRHSGWLPRHERPREHQGPGQAVTWQVTFATGLR